MADDEIKLVGPAIYNAASENVIIVGDLVIAPVVKRVFWKDRQVTLSKNEFTVVSVLASNARDISYLELHETLRGVGFVVGTGPSGYMQNVRTTVKRIRRRFEEIDPHFNFIETYSGFGYRWRRPALDTFSGFREANNGKDNKGSV